MTDRIASLGMYDAAPLQASNDQLWAAIARRLRAAGLDRVPNQLERRRPLDDIWSDPDLLLAQTCGYPLMTEWSGRLRYLATPCYAATGCEGPYHRSRFVARTVDVAESLLDFRGRRVAINEARSNTGANLLRSAVARHARGSRFFGSVLQTGSHRESARAVATGDADIAAIDAVTYAHIERHERDLGRELRTIGWSPATPGLPFVTSRDTPAEIVKLLRRVLREVVQSPDMRDPREALLLRDLAVIPMSRYETILTHKRNAERLGYRVIA